MYIIRNQLNCAEMYFLGWEEFKCNSRTKSMFHKMVKLTLLIMLEGFKGSKKSYL